jgi:glycosyltransferase involved in cell wall biosynthesis
MKVLHVTPTFWPATYWGGPILSTYGLCNALAAKPGIELKVLTTDAAGPRVAQRVKAEGSPAHFPAGYDVYFTRRVIGREVAPGLLARLFAMVWWSDVVHLTGTYSFPTIPTLLACHLLKKPLIWSPRGALKAAHEWDDASKPRLKKAWERLCSALLPTRCVLHVTSEAEGAASHARLPKTEAVVIPNGVDVPAELPAREWLPKGKLRLMYIGRLAREKGIENLLHAFSRLDERDATLEIYGTGEDRYKAVLAELSRCLGLDGRVRFHGHVDGAAKRNAFLGADVCVVPSHTENFGMVVAEALAHGVPVIASRGTPWSQLETRKCGSWVNNSPDELARAVRRIRENDLADMGKRGRQWMSEAFSWEVVVARMSEVYRSMVERATKTELQPHP